MKTLNGSFLACNIPFLGTRINVKRFTKTNVEQSTKRKWKKGAKRFQKLNVELPMNANVKMFLKNSANWLNSRLINNIAKMFQRDIAGKKNYNIWAESCN